MIVTESQQIELNKLKEEGNNYFKDGKYSEAIESYTKGISIDADNYMYSASSNN